MGENKIDTIQYAQIPKKYVLQHYNEMFGMIHVVSYHAIDQYLEIIRRHYWSKSDYIVKQQQSLLEHVDQITPRNQWRYFAPK